MADYRDAVNFIQAWEGGISGHPEDNASSNPSPCGNDPRYNAPIHTNKGITWTTYTNAVSGANCAEFLAMPQPVWLYIWEKKYFDAVGGNLISNQAIANTYASWAWGSGVGGANNLMQSVLINDYGYELSQVSSKYSRVAILNELSEKDSQELFNRLIAARESYFRSLSDFSVFGNGWLNRLRDFKKYNQKYVDNAFGGISKQIVMAVAILLIALIFTYFAIK
jgi:peptidoglycan LD-endopeptidase CwlK